MATQGEHLERTAVSERSPSTTGPQSSEVQAGMTQQMAQYEPQRGRWGRRFLLLIGMFGILVALYLGLQALNLIPHFHNPFNTQTTDRSSPVVLKSIQDLSRFEAASGNYQVIVDLKKDNRFIPDFIFSQRTLFVGIGSVDAYVDFSTIGSGAISVSSDGKSVTVTLPPPALERPNIDHDKSYVYGVDRGVVNRVGDFFSNNPNDQAQLYSLAEQKIAQAAQDSGLKERAEANTKSTLESLLHSLGYTNVTVTFTAP
jgi:uncharacterized protein DUF4230